MMYQNTEIATEWIGGEAAGAIRFWIELQCHAREEVRGWAFLVGGSAAPSKNFWHYGYASELEARNKAIDLIEEYLKADIRQAEARLVEVKTLLAEVNQLQRQRNGIY